MNRTHTCGQLTINNLNQDVILQGWINKIRKMGKLIFIDLKDRYGITQLVFDSEKFKDYTNLKNDYVIEIQGKVIERKSKNLNILTGEIEIQVTNLEIINESILLPFEIVDDTTAKEDTRLKYRYLDLRRPKMQQNLIFRSKLNQIIRNFLIDYDFVEIETPIFGKTTPEGARDYLVPSRINKHKFYSLPQSPQLYKQLLMVSGMDRYFQIARCFRDEDLRIDRQPEFTQLDLEMSFANSNDLMKIIELLFKKILKELKNIDLTTPIQKLKWKQAIDLYGSDKPDLRYELQIKTVNEIFKNTNIPIFNDLKNQSIRAICVETILTNKQINQLSEVAKQNGAKQLIFVKYENNQWIGLIASKLTNQEKNLLINKFNIKNSGTILFVVDNYLNASKIIGTVRVEVAKLCNLIDNNTFHLLWVVDFPLYEFSEDENRYIAAHHPFTMPSEQFIDDFDKNFKNCTAQAFDLVMNGFELGSGSQRITKKDIQMRMFKSLNINDKQIEQNFGWFLKAYEYGAPNHLGMALGLDRIMMLLTNSANIREVIAFPKNSSGIDPMTDAPSYVDSKQLDELNIKLK